ncbi:hypothetical protein MH117_24675 [Paenibacillus sp. ACRRX]|uniref:hypothetical protein n=1 Tax=Paenibacillus sp. ACRRX TaxID=2918206 RepID=UPI001EF71918|nr:hypothetical protein [Paenibacillus sp. ACRRX]MCG7410596.1 hypothetical protein [Paenibacillus sp. ACRRX]
MMDKYWLALIFLFKENGKLSRYATSEYIDLAAGTVHVKKLQTVSKPWSASERFMLQLALHLYSERNKVNLSDMDRLDSYNKKLALQAIQIRFF